MAQPFKQSQLMVASFNIAGPNWMGYPDRKKVAQRVYRDMDTVQLIGFQEFGIHNYDGLKSIRRHMHFLHGEKLGHYNVNTIAYDGDRLTAAEHGTFWLSEDKTKKPGWGGGIRAASWAKFDDNMTDQPFGHVNAHLDNKDAEAREKGILQILEFIESEFEEGLPVIITADSNVSIQSPDVRWRAKEMRAPYDLLVKAGFVDTWTATHKSQNTSVPDVLRPYTFHGFQGSHYRLDEYGTYDTDWIFVRGFNPLNSVPVYDSYGSTFPSDHYPITAQLGIISK